MNRLFFIILLSLFAACQPSKKVSETEEIKALLLSQQQAWNDGNIDAFMDGYHRDSGMQFIGAKGVRFGWQATLNAYRKNYPTPQKMGRLVFDLDKIELLDGQGDIGHVLGRWKLIRATDTPAGHFSLITKRISGKHKITIDHTW